MPSAFFESAPDALLVIDAAGVIRHANARAHDLFGYAPGGLVGREASELIPAGSRAAAEDRAADALAAYEQRRRSVEVQALRMDGTEFPADVTRSQVAINGEVFLLAAVRDVAERKRLESYIAGLLDAAPDAIVAVDTRGLIQLVNKQAETLFDYDRNELVGLPLERLVPERVRGAHAHHSEAYVAHPRTRPMDAGLHLSAVRRDGTEFPVDIALSSLQTDAGLLVTAAVRDITDRVALERQFQGLLEAAPDAMVGVDAEGTIRLVNREAERIFGYDRSELIGSQIERLVPAAVRGHHPQHRRSYMADPRTRPMGAGLKLSAVRKDGSEFPVDIALSALQTETGLLVTAAVRDITARVEAEREQRIIQEELQQARLRQAQRLETVGQLAGGIAHDFNNLLAVILNYAEFLADDLPEGEMRRDVEQIRRAASRAADLTRQLLIFARREVVKPELLDLNEVLMGVENILRRALGEHVEFTTVLAETLPSVRADAGQLEQVFMNLVVNARDAMPTGGRLIVETKAVELDDVYTDAHPGVAPGRYVRLTVSDTGSGMSPEVVARAFEPFFTTKPAGTGTGLGLATVYGIVTQAGGNVGIYSEVGSGTLVAIHLPAVDEPATPLPERARVQDLATGTGQSLLVVEDEGAVLLSTIRILGMNGYRVYAQSNPIDAIDLLKDGQKRIDLLITDMVMPGISGIELARRAREIRPGLPVLYMSGYSSEVITRQGGVESGSRLLQKPFTRVELLDAVRDALGGHRMA